MVGRPPGSRLFPYTTLFRSDVPLDLDRAQALIVTSRNALRSITSHPELDAARSEEHTSELQSQFHLVCRLLLEKKNPATAAGPIPNPTHFVRQLCQPSADDA